LARLIEIEDSAKKDLAKLDKQVAKRITEFLRNRIAPLDNPRLLGQASHGKELGTLWTYRVGDNCMSARFRTRRFEFWWSRSETGAKSTVKSTQELRNRRDHRLLLVFA
jgi:hypothetical protein